MYGQLEKLVNKEDTQPLYVDLKHKLDITRVEFLNTFRHILGHCLNCSIEDKELLRYLYVSEGAVTLPLWFCGSCYVTSMVLRELARYLYGSEEAGTLPLWSCNVTSMVLRELLRYLYGSEGACTLPLVLWELSCYLYGSEEAVMLPLWFSGSWQITSMVLRELACHLYGSEGAGMLPLWFCGSSHVTSMVLRPSLSEMERKNRVEDYMSVLTECLSEKVFMRDYHKYFPVDVDLELLSMVSQEVYPFILGLDRPIL
uniref:Uncharacterized protein n=1 Tax=Timema monikensis TaxID=170555 RepID=A0A7R9EHM1_9NEOP|nr:unnamed protein product [Timema monikensis]